MKRLETILDEEKLRQVLVLIADCAPEIHVYDIPINQPAVQEKPRLLKDSRPILRRKRGKPGETAPDIILRELRNGKTLSHKQLANLGVENGFSKETLKIAAGKMKRKGKITLGDDSLYRLIESNSK